MAINFVPKPGMVLMCEFGPNPNDFGGEPILSGPLGVPPEMTKNRFVVVMTPGKSHHGTCVVVPLSTVPPPEVQKYHHCFTAGQYQFLTPLKDSWAKTNMVTTVSYRRLDRVRVNGKYATPYLEEADFKKIKACVAHALQL
ncbi:type II toxin-antitoxin system PemK/MazF family toxin [Brucella pituitosa]|uniref:type II toxin-antitoxin system PemK/MazF family toxin n=1 Tax=Brucella pituitosa TaxID=571256 RepID=UPI003F4AD1B7